MAGLADYFCGRVEQREYAQVHDFEFGTYANGLGGTGAYRNLVTARVVEQTFRFEGVPASLAESTAAVTVTDVGGNSYTFKPLSSFTDGSTGTLVYEVENVQVSRARMSPHMWALVVVRRAVRYFLNGERIALSNEPSWANGYF